MAGAFGGSKKGEFFELKAELNSQSNSVRKEAVRKTIAAMTIGKDVSSLFTDVLKCMQSPQIDIKKLVYLYIVSYAHTKPVSLWFPVHSNILQIFVFERHEGAEMQRRSAY